MKKFILISFIVTSLASAQVINWQEITSQYNMPNGVKIFKGTREFPKLQAFYVDIDMNNQKLAVRPYIDIATNLKTFTKKVGAYVAVNGGFFGNGVSLSSVIYPNEVKSQNVTSLTRNSKSYPVIRSLFSMKKDGNYSIDWIYHFGSTINDIYKFNSPLPYTENDPNPKPEPSKNDGELFNDILVGIGGAPRLIKNGQINITYNEEIMWGSGVGLINKDPRTAVGITSNKHIILFVADGRQTISDGVSLTELAEILLNLGCKEAMNLDGGGSTQMAVQDKYINSPSETRAVPTILAVVDYDSLKISKLPTYEKIIDTGDLEASAFGTGWFQTANAGYYGSTPALLNLKGDGSNYFKFTPNLTKSAEYELYGWWVSASNRCTDTPFIVNHSKGVDTVRVNQQLNGSKWNLIGKFYFGDSNKENVIISNAAKNGTYVVADAIRFVSYDSATNVLNENFLPTAYTLEQNYPNPFNPSTTIRFAIPKEELVSLKVYNVLGQEVATLVNQNLKAGSYAFDFDARKLTSGVYFYTIQAGKFSETKKMLLLK